MVNRSESASAARSSLSSLMDGELAPGTLADACSAWRDDAEARACWHTYHLIGDVLRSDDLAATPARDAAFLQALRARLADEPVPLAPGTLAEPAAAGPAPANVVVASLAAPPRRAAGWGGRGGWLVAPAAVAAGFVAVAGVLVVMRSQGPEGGPVLAQSAPVATPAVVPAEVVRNAGLDRYLQAHRTVANGVAAAGGAEQRVHIVFEAK